MTKGCVARPGPGLRIALSLGLVLCAASGVGLAHAQGSSTTVSKSTAAPQAGPQGALRPSIGEEVISADNAAPVGEIVPQKIDEGASWQVAVEQARGPTPLIGQKQAEAVQRINAYFNGMTSLEGNFNQTDASNKQTHGRFYVLRPGKIRFD
ncbi:MAG: outer-membrane lipoprotein carrier protein LolA, partial [Pseudomonadota bacterium]